MYNINKEEFISKTQNYKILAAFNYSMLCPKIDINLFREIETVYAIEVIKKAESPDFVKWRSKRAFASIAGRLGHPNLFHLEMTIYY